MSTEDWNKLANVTPLRLYHISAALYPELKTKAMLNPDDSDLKPWDNNISFLLRAPTKELVKEYIKAQFTKWEMDECYLYVVDPREVINYTYASMESTSEQLNYDDKHWDSTIEKLPDRQYFPAKRRYMQKRKNFLENKGIKSKMTLYEIFSHKEYYNWSNMNWFQYNLKHGDKNQYATCIPHVQVNTTFPIQYEKVIKLF